MTAWEREEFFTQDALTVAPLLLGSILTVTHLEADGGQVSAAIRLTEVEAYLGPADSERPDPGSHTYRGKTPRNRVMFGPPCHLYTYFIYGMHWAANIVCSPEGQASGVLLRAGEILDGVELVRGRRLSSKKHVDLAQGPGRLAQAMRLGRAEYGARIELLTQGEVPGVAASVDAESTIDPSRIAPLADGTSLSLSLPSSPLPSVKSGPRVGTRGDAGTELYPWRFWLDGDPTVSRFVPGKPA